MRQPGGGRDRMRNETHSTHTHTIHTKNLWASMPPPSNAAASKSALARRLPRNARINVITRMFGSSLLSQAFAGRPYFFDHIAILKILALEIKTYF
jgi:hypothetical protein